MRNQILQVIAVMAVLTCTVNAEKFDLDVYASKFDSIPIGIVDFVSTNNSHLSGTEPWKVIAGDLDFCGRFNVVARNSYDSLVFANANTGIYIDGDYTVEGNQVLLQCYLRDATNKELIIGKKYKGDMKMLRSMAHRYSDEIVEMLFGDRGFFESRIVYVKTGNNNKKQIALMDFDGYNSIDLTKNSAINIFPVFADSGTIIWTSYIRGKPDLYRGSIFDGTSKLFISSKGTEASPDVSVIDGTIAYASSKNGNMDVYTCASDGTNVRQLTFQYGVDISPCWSPNGYQLAFTSDRSGNPQIYIMDADGANQHRLTFESKYADSPAWSPKGDKIAYMSMDENSKFDIWTIGPDGTNCTKVTSIGGNNEYPAWSPDGTLIAFINTTYSGKSDMYVVKPDGTRLRQVTHSGDVRMPDWSGF